MGFIQHSEHERWYKSTCSHYHVIIIIKSAAPATDRPLSSPRRAQQLGDPSLHRTEEPRRTFRARDHVVLVVIVYFLGLRGEQHTQRVHGRSIYMIVTVRQGSSLRSGVRRRFAR